MSGVIERPFELRLYDYDLCCGATSKTDPTDLPEAYTIPEENIPPVHDQGSVGACVSFAMCQCAESDDLYNEKDIKHYSPTWNYGRKESRGTLTGSGLIPSKAIKGAMEIGFISESLFPNFNLEVPEVLDVCKERDDILSESTKKKIAGYSTMNYALESKKWDTIRQALYDNKRALLITSKNFFRGGGHAIIAIGWSNTNGKQKGQYIEFQNSWGESYKNKGRYFIPLSYISEAYALSWDQISVPFTDVQESDWFFKDVRSAYLSGLIQGVTKTEFVPEDNIIRGDLAVIVSRVMDKLEYSLNTYIKSQNQLGKDYKEIHFENFIDGFRFKDVDESKYYAEAVNKAFANGIITGDENNLFNPEVPITRAEMAAVLVRLYLKIATVMEEGLPNLISIEPTDISSLKDVSSDDWFYGYIQMIYTLGFMIGTSEDSFEPYKNLSRAEAATIFVRLFKKVDQLLDSAY